MAKLPISGAGRSPPQSMWRMRACQAQSPGNSPCSPRRRWPHSGTRMIYPGRRSRVCTREGEGVETVGSGRVPQSWCSGFQSLQWRWGGERKKRKWISLHFCFTSEFIGLCPKFSNNTCKDRPTKPVVTVSTALGILTLMMGCSAVYKVIPYVSLSLQERQFYHHFTLKRNRVRCAVTCPRSTGQW